MRYMDDVLLDQIITAYKQTSKRWITYMQFKMLQNWA